MKKLQAIKGMKDCLPSETPLWQYVENTLQDVVQRYGYQEIRFPILDNTELFKRSIGEVTDIVEKEMYTFADRDGENITLRPEGTACCVRACEEHQLLYNRGNLAQKLWYCGPMFRHEKPQKGRLRQFHQIGLEAFGYEGADIEAEMLSIIAQIWKAFGVEKAVKLHINCIGSSACRGRYKAALTEYLQQHINEIDADSQRRLTTNPLRILDSKDAGTQSILKGAPVLTDYLNDDSIQHFERLKSYLSALKVPFTVDPCLVRGLDYYNDTVFEWITDKLGAQGTVCGGGRYNSLVEQLGGRATYAFGFGMGLERLVLLLQELDVIPASIFNTVDVYVVAVGIEMSEALIFAQAVRAQCTYLNVQMHLGGGSFKSQMKKADKSGAEIALILGEDELNAGEVTIKYLRNGGDLDGSLHKDREQKTVKQNTLKQYLS